MKLLLAIVFTFICATNADLAKYTEFTNEDCTGDWTTELTIPNSFCEDI